MALQTPVVAGNWKMHLGPSRAREFVSRFLEAYQPRQDHTVILFPSAVSIEAVHRSVTDRPDIRLGIQHLHWEPQGAFTGEISPAMAVDAGATYALIGHSERRHLFGETIDETLRKTRAALAAGLSPMLCVGETLQERRDGRAEQVVAGQLLPVIRTLTDAETDNFLIAYEPVWAIGTGETASPAAAAAMHTSIRAILSTELTNGASVPILYGGSVKPGNVADLLAEPALQGVLVGGASLDPADFAAICSVSS
jgi:triosephosphate isomerase